MVSGAFSGELVTTLVNTATTATCNVTGVVRYNLAVFSGVYDVIQ